MITIWLSNRGLDPLLRYQFNTPDDVKTWWRPFLNSNPHAQILSISEDAAKLPYVTLFDNLTYAEVTQNAIRELGQMHSTLHKDCLDQGPTTCPTWEAIYKLRGLLK